MDLQSSSCDSGYDGTPQDSGYASASSFDYSPAVSSDEDTGHLSDYAVDCAAAGNDARELAVERQEARSRRPLSRYPLLTASEARAAQRKEEQELSQAAAASSARAAYLLAALRARLDHDAQRLEYALAGRRWDLGWPRDHRCAVDLLHAYTAAAEREAGEERERRRLAHQAELARQASLASSGGGWGVRGARPAAPSGSPPPPLPPSCKPSLGEASNISLGGALCASGGWGTRSAPDVDGTAALDVPRPPPSAFQPPPPPQWLAGAETSKGAAALLRSTRKRHSPTMPLRGDHDWRSPTANFMDSKSLKARETRWEELSDYLCDWVPRELWGGGHRPRDLNTMHKMEVPPLPGSGGYSKATAMDLESALTHFDRDNHFYFDDPALNFYTNVGTHKIHSAAPRFDPLPSMYEIAQRHEARYLDLHA